MSLSQAQIEEGFGLMGERALAAGCVVDVAVYGGAALVLALNAREATQDVDAVFENDKHFVRQAALEVAREKGWPDDWLNDAVKGFLSTRDQGTDHKTLFRTYPSEDRPGLRVYIAVPEYLFAMKAMAMRLGGVDVSQDIEDLKTLAQEIGLSTAQEALDLVAAFYPRSRIPAKTQFGLEELFDTLSQNQGDHEAKDG